MPDTSDAQIRSFRRSLCLPGTISTGSDSRSMVRAIAAAHTAHFLLSLLSALRKKLAALTALLRTHEISQSS